MARYVSSAFDFCGGRFPQQNSCFAVEYDEMKCKFSERFNLEILNGVFEAFLKCNGELVIPLFTDIPDQRNYKRVNESFYEFDKQKYKATIETTVLQALGVNKCIAVRLANDGFLYSRENELGGEWNKNPAHRVDRWYYLDETESAKLQALSSFAKKRFPGETESRFRYSSDVERVDFCIRDSQKNALKICFEYLSPADDFPDAWMAESNPDSWFIGTSESAPK